MPDLPLRSDLLQVGINSLLSAGGATRINAKVATVPGSDLNIILNAAALMGEEIVRSLQRCMRGNFAATARADALDRRIMDTTGGQLPRKDAAPATVGLTLSRANAGAGAGIVSAGTRVTASTGQIFALDVDVSFGALDLVEETTATCTQTGPDGNVPAGVLNRFIDQPFDTSITVTNAEAAAGGTDEEDDVRYSGRFFGFFPTLSKATLAAIRQGALGVAGVEVASATEVVNPDGTPAAAVALVVGDAAGDASGPMLQAVRDAMLEFRAAGIPVFVSGGVVINQAVSWSGLQYVAGTDSVAAQNAVRAVTVAAAQFLSPGATLYRSVLIAAARAVPGVIVGEGALVVPAGDIVPDAPEQVLRVRAQDVTFG